MRDWNVVATTRDGTFRRARELLSPAGSVSRTQFYNVMVMRVPEVEGFLDWLVGEWSKGPRFPDTIAHVRPARQAFVFHSPEEFEAKARELVLSWAPKLAGKAFHVRLHRRGFKGRLSTPEEERFLDEVLLERLSSNGTPARVTFDNPDTILAIDTVGERAGLGLWTSEERRRFVFLGVD
ncbi:MAG TPA: THUMP domain-containing protein [Vicinamibacteria bacterium]|nr:THUMP domain-containing protein [Vicinamibacteria bacterium]